MLLQHIKPEISLLGPLACMKNDPVGTACLERVNIKYYFKEYMLQNMNKVEFR